MKILLIFLGQVTLECLVEMFVGVAWQLLLGLVKLILLISTLLRCLIPMDQLLLWVVERLAGLVHVGVVGQLAVRDVVGDSCVLDRCFCIQIIVVE